MTISELITQLASIKASNGDLPVLLADWNEDYSPPEECAVVEVRDIGSYQHPTFVVLNTKQYGFEVTE